MSIRLNKKLMPKCFYNFAQKCDENLIKSDLLSHNLIAQLNHH